MAFIAILLAVVSSAVINERLVAELTENAEDTTDLIESLNLGSQSLQSHAYQARSVLNKILKEPSP